MTGGHGHVIPRPDGQKARCGGPAFCTVCATELANKRATGSPLARYRKKTFAIQAVRWYPGNPDLNSLLGIYEHELESMPLIVQGNIQTRSCVAGISPGDWVVIFADGTKDVYSPPRFEAEFEPA